MTEVREKRSREDRRRIGRELRKIIRRELLAPKDHFFIVAPSIPNLFSPIAESTAVFNIFSAAGNAMTDAEKYEVDKFIRANVAAGNWSKLLIFCFYCLSSRTKAVIDWMGYRNGIEVGTLTWSQTGGFTSDGAASYIRTQFVPSTDGGTKYTVNNGCWGQWILGGNAGNIGGVLGTVTTNQLLMSTNGTPGGGFWGRVHSSDNLIVGAAGMVANANHSCQRTAGSGANAIAVIRNGKKSFGTSTATGIPNRELYLNGMRNGSSGADSPNIVQAGAHWVLDPAGFDWTVWEESLRMLYAGMGLTATPYTNNAYPLGLI